MSIEARSRGYDPVFEHWRIGERLGFGSNNNTVVFELIHSGSDTIKSALKVVRLIEREGSYEALSDAAKDEYEREKQRCKDRAQREVLLMNELRDCIHIVSYHDHCFREWKEETGFGCDMLIRMELLQDLRKQMVAGRTFSPGEILNIAIDSCTGVVHCHGKNIVHRDIKPGNIFFDETGSYKLGDLGIARILDGMPASEATAPRFTMPYAPKEQLSSPKPEPWFDIYSLGLVLYELSNGNRLPFAQSCYATESEIRKRMQASELPPPCKASEAFAAVILKACAPNKKDRYQTAEEFLAALMHLKQADPSVQETTPPPEPVPPEAAPSEDPYATQEAQPAAPSRTNTLAFGIQCAAALIILLFVFFVVGTWIKISTLQRAQDFANKGDYVSALTLCDKTPATSRKIEINLDEFDKAYATYRDRILSSAAESAMKQDYTSAIALLTSAIEEVPDDPLLISAYHEHCNTYLAYVLERVDAFTDSGDSDGAISQIDAALALLPSHPVLTEKRQRLVDAKP